MVELFNALTGEEYWVAFDIKQAKAGWLHGFLTFLPGRNQQAAVDSLLRMEVILPNTSLLLNTLKQKKLSHEVGLDRYLGGTSIRE